MPCKTTARLSTQQGSFVLGEAKVTPGLLSSSRSMMATLILLPS